jgi:hypothetical protein
MEPNEAVRYTLEFHGCSYSLRENVSSPLVPQAAAEPVQGGVPLVDDEPYALATPASKSRFNPGPAVPRAKDAAKPRRGNRLWVGVWNVTSNSCAFLRGALYALWSQ